jgi:hypothetical protein
VRECVPGIREDVVKLAFPLPFKATPVARIAAPSRKLTVPVGIPNAGATACTDAVRVIDCTSEDGFKLEFRVATVCSLSTVWLREPEVLVTKFTSPV